METTATIALSRRINYRLVVLLGVVGILLGYPLYWFLRTALTHGIVDRGEYVEVDLKAMSDFSFDQVNGADEDIPQRFRQLDGRRVMLVGEMFSGRAAAGRPADFELCYSIQKCCFVGVPQIQHFVKCTVPRGRKVEFYDGPVRVIGILHVGVQREGAQILSIYRLEVESVRPVR